jgi:hypothetical protein
MAGYAAVAAVGLSMERLLNACFAEEEPIDSRTTRAVLIRTEDLRRQGGGPRVIPAHALTIMLYRVDLNKTVRAGWSAVGSQNGRAHLPVDLHYLLTAWGDNAEFEHRIIGRTLQCLESAPVLSGPLLHASGGWAENEAVQLVIDEMSTEAVMRTFDSLPHDYKLSVPYVARVVRLDSRTALPVPTVGTAATRITAAP